MNTHRSHNLRKSTSGFSLIEVVLALAVATVGLVAILGLFPQGLSSARNAVDDSFTAIIAQDTIAGRRADLQNGTATLGIAANPDTRWFTPDGHEILLTNNTDALPAMYRCEVKASPLTGVAPNLESTRVVIYWPWYRKSDAPNQSTMNTNIFVTEIAVY